MDNFNPLSPNWSSSSREVDAHALTECYLKGHEKNLAKYGTLFNRTEISFFPPIMFSYL